MKMKVVKSFSPVFYAAEWLINRREKHPQIQLLDLRVFAVPLKSENRYDENDDDGDRCGIPDKEFPKAVHHRMHAQLVVCL